MLRTNYIMHFFCSQCGAQLELPLKGDVKAGSVWEFSHQEPKEPTGAECHYSPRVFVKPCRQCIEKETKPVQALIEAVSKIEELQKLKDKETA